MKRGLYKLLSLVLVLAMLLCGCNGEVIRDLAHSLGQALATTPTEATEATDPTDISDPTAPTGGEEEGTFTAFADMVYTRPDLDAIRTQLQVCLDAAPTATDPEALMDEVYAFYDLYYDFYTNYSLAYIHNSKDLTDEYWNEEYGFCLENTSVADSSLDDLLYTLADSPVKEGLEAEEHFGAGFFDDYLGESIWDDTYTALIDEENALLSQYYDWTGQSGRQEDLAQLYVELVTVRQEIATYLGYESYIHYAYDETYDRDYTPEQAIAYMADIQKELVPFVDTLTGDYYAPTRRAWSEKKTMDYVRQCANAMGGTVKDAFDLLEKGGYYDLAVDYNKYDSSFETYLYNYDVPFVFINAQGSGNDPLTFAHEFGHFCNDYAAGGTSVTIDVAEIFSQGMEFLSLDYGQNTAALAKMKMKDSLDVFIGQSLFATFEYQVYQLSGDDLNVGNISKLYLQTMADFGYNIEHRDPLSFIHIPHFYIVPIYIISYVVSNDAALQIYQEEQKEAGRGLTLYMDSLDTEAQGFLEFLAEAGLNSPFYEGRAAEIRETMESVLR